MNLSQLLSELRVGILNDRSDRTAGTSDYLWTDAMLVRYINEAQRRFAARSLIIRDGTTPEATQVTLEEGVTEYTLHPSVIAVMSARLADADRDLQRIGHSLLNGYRRVDESIAWDLSQLASLPAGSPVAYTTDEQVTLGEDDTYSSVTLRVYPEPSADVNGDILQLRVVRKPIDELTTSNMSAVPEIPADHHLEMLDWAAYLALRIVDDDAGSPRRAAEFAASFEEHVRAARTMVMRKLFAPQPWGFGRGGWSWEG